jgi:hypothetical protein
MRHPGGIWEDVVNHSDSSGSGEGRDSAPFIGERCSSVFGTQDLSQVNKMTRRPSAGMPWGEGHTLLR